MSIEVRGITKTFNHFKALDGVSLKVETGTLVALLGPSGSGKSTLLRIIAGLEREDGGEIHLTGKAATELRARDRNVGFVFQHYALFKHMTVEENVGFGLSVRGHGRAEVRERVEELIRLVQLEGLNRRYPSQLSGGQRQRVALARALAPKPSVLLLDEPFGALDAKVREELREWICRLHEQSQVTTLFVTHDQHEALEIADRIIVMNRGRIEQEGKPLQIFDRPATHFVARFVGETNYIEASVCEPDLVCWGPFKFSVSGFKTGEKVRIYFRPNDVYVSQVQETLQVPARIARTRFRGPLIELGLEIGEGRSVTALVPKGVALASGFAEGGQVFVGITAFHSFPTG